MGAHGKGRIDLNGKPLDYEPEDPYAGEIADFVAAAGEGREPEVNGEEGLHNVELLLEADP